jgi:hypothetical protein
MVLFQIHSLLRYGVLAAGLGAFLFLLVGMTSGKPAGKGVRIAGSIFVGLFDLQVLLGLATLLTRPFYPALVGHFVPMLLAAAIAHVLLAKNRRSATPGFRLPLIGIGLALMLVVIGIFAIGRGVLTTTAF